MKGNKEWGKERKEKKGKILSSLACDTYRKRCDQVGLCQNVLDVHRVPPPLLGYLSSFGPLVLEF